MTPRAWSSAAVAQVQRSSSGEVEKQFVKVQCELQQVVLIVSTSLRSVADGLILVFALTSS